MSGRFWIFIGAVFGGLSVAAGAIGAHALPASSALGVPVQIFNTGQNFHATHTLAILAVGVLLLVTENQRTPWSSWGMELAAASFALGILCFSGGIYIQIFEGFTSSGGIVPIGGVAFLIGWTALAVSAFGVRR